MGGWPPMVQSNPVMDQAAGLRHLQSADPVRVIAVTSGKGGVGKSNVSVNLSVAMANQGKRVMLLDADLGLANVDVLLGLRPQANLSHVLEGRVDLEEIILEGPGGIQVIPAASGVAKMAELSPRENAGLIHAFNELSGQLDALVIDTAAGIADSVLRFAMAAQEVLVVVCDEPASITDAYALIKVMNREHGLQRFRILANMVHSATEGRELFNKLRRASEQFLDVTLEYQGMVPFDEHVRKAVQRQSAVVSTFPRSPAGMAFKKLAADADKWPVAQRVRGHVEFFMDRLIQNSGESQGVAL